MTGKFYSGVQVERIFRDTKGLIDAEQVGFRSGKKCVDQIFTPKRLTNKARKKKQMLYLGKFYGRS